LTGLIRKFFVGGLADEYQNLVDVGELDSGQVLDIWPWRTIIGKAKSHNELKETHLAGNWPHHSSHRKGLLFGEPWSGYFGEIEKLESCC